MTVVIPLPCWRMTGKVVLFALGVKTCDAAPVNASEPVPGTQMKFWQLALPATCSEELLKFTVVLTLLVSVVTL